MKNAIGRATLAVVAMLSSEATVLAGGQSPGTAAAGRASDIIVTKTCTPLTKTKVTNVHYGTAPASNSTTLADLPSASVTFVQGGKGAGCAILRFSANTFVFNSGEALLVRAVLDNATSGPAGIQQFNASGAAYSVDNAYDFIFPNVKPGTHTIKMQYATNGVGFVSVYDLAMVVQYR